jgi:hypothetical protein
MLAGAGVGIGAAFAIAPSAQAAPSTFTVGTTIDTGSAASDCAVATNTDCRLRDAITAANTNGNAADQDVIVFASSITGSPGTITLGSTLPIVTQSVSIQGPGTAPGNSNITVSGDDSHRILNFFTTGDDQMKVSGLTLTHGYTDPQPGAAIYITDADSNGPAPDLTLLNSLVSYSTANGTGGYGGGISSDRAGVTIDHSTIDHNIAERRGGGVYVFGGETNSLTIDHSTISNNSTTGTSGERGGGVASTATATITDSTITGNSTGGSSSDGGGLAFTFDATVQNSSITGNSTSGTNSDGAGIFSDSSQLSVENSTLSGNHTDGAFSWGGGIYSYYGAATIESSTVSGNNVNGNNSNGGGIATYANATTLRNSTIAGNGANGSGTGSEGKGGGVYNLYDYADPVLQNTIVAGNTAVGIGPDLAAPHNTFQAAFSLIQDTSDATINTTVPGSNITGVDPDLQPLALNSSLNGTQTQALALTSPAIDCGSSFGETTDQRGGAFARPVELARTNSTAAGADGSDIGSFEVQSGAASGACPNNAPPAPPPTQNPPAPVQPAFNLKAAIAKCKKKFPKGPKRKKCIRKARAKANA